MAESTTLSKLKKYQEASKKPKPLVKGKKYQAKKIKNAKQLIGYACATCSSS